MSSKGSKRGATGSAVSASKRQKQSSTEEVEEMASIYSEDEIMGETLLEPVRGRKKNTTATQSARSQKQFITRSIPKTIGCFPRYSVGEVLIIIHPTNEDYHFILRKQNLVPDSPFLQELLSTPIKEAKPTCKSVNKIKYVVELKSINGAFELTRQPLSFDVPTPETEYSSLFSQHSVDHASEAHARRDEITSRSSEHTREESEIATIIDPKRESGQTQASRPLQSTHFKHSEAARGEDIQKSRAYDKERLETAALAPVDLTTPEPVPIPRKKRNHFARLPEFEQSQLVRSPPLSTTTFKKGPESGVLASNDLMSVTNSSEYERSIMPPRSQAADVSTSLPSSFKTHHSASMSVDPRLSAEYGDNPEARIKDGFDLIRDYLLDSLDVTGADIESSLPSDNGPAGSNNSLRACNSVGEPANNGTMITNRNGTPDITFQEVVHAARSNSYIASPANASAPSVDLATSGPCACLSPSIPKTQKRILVKFKHAIQYSAADATQLTGSDGPFDSERDQLGKIEESHESTPSRLHAIAVDDSTQKLTEFLKPKDNTRTSASHVEQHDPFFQDEQMQNAVIKDFRDCKDTLKEVCAQPSPAEFLAEETASIEKDDNRGKLKSLQIKSEIKEEAKDEPSLIITGASDALNISSNSMKDLSLQPPCQKRSRNTLDGENHNAIHSQEKEDVVMEAAKSSSHKRHIFHATTQPPETNLPSEQVCKAWSDVFAVLSGEDPEIDVAMDIFMKFKMCQNIVSCAQTLRCVETIAPVICYQLHNYGGQLWKAIATDPMNWLVLAIAIKSQLIFDGAFVHVVGCCINHKIPQAWTDPISRLPPGVRKIFNEKINEYDDLMRNVNEYLMMLTISKGPDKQPITITQYDTSSYDAFLVVSLWRNWIVTGFQKYQNRPKRLGQFYRTIQQGGDAYLPLKEVNSIMERLRKPDFGEWKEIGEDLMMLKNAASGLVTGICRDYTSTSVQLDYLTCVHWDHDVLVPWEGGQER